MKTLIFKNPRLKIALKNPELVRTVIVVVKIINSKFFIIQTRRSKIEAYRIDQ